MNHAFVPNPESPDHCYFVVGQEYIDGVLTREFHCWQPRSYRSPYSGMLIAHVPS